MLTYSKIQFERINEILTHERKTIDDFHIMKHDNRLNVKKGSSTEQTTSFANLSYGLYSL